MIKVEITHAEVLTQYGSEEVIKEFKTEKGGTIVNFQIKTRIDDKKENSPHIYQKCVYFADTEDKLIKIKNILKAGNILEIKGSQDRSSYIDKKSGEKKYSESIKIREITPIAIDSKSSSSDDGLPF